MEEYSIFLLYKGKYSANPRAVSGFHRVVEPISLDFPGQRTKISLNNTPPASLLALGLECSAPRGVTHFWGGLKIELCQQTAASEARKKVPLYKTAHHFRRSSQLARAAWIGHSR